MMDAMMESTPGRICERGYLPKLFEYALSRVGLCILLQNR